MPKQRQIGGMWNGAGVCSNLASSGEPPPPLHKTSLTTAYTHTRILAVTQIHHSMDSGKRYIHC